MERVRGNRGRAQSHPLLSADTRPPPGDGWRSGWTDLGERPRRRSLRVRVAPSRGAHRLPVPVAARRSDHPSMGRAVFGHAQSYPRSRLPGRPSRSLRARLYRPRGLDESPERAGDARPSARAQERTGLPVRQPKSDSVAVRTDSDGDRRRPQGLPDNRGLGLRAAHRRRLTNEDQLAIASWYSGDDAFMKRSSILISAMRLPAASVSAVSNHMNSVLGLWPSATMLPLTRYGRSTRTGPLMLRSSIAPNRPTAWPSLPRSVAIGCVYRRCTIAAGVAIAPPHGEGLVYHSSGSVMTFIRSAITSLVRNASHSSKRSPTLSEPRIRNWPASNRSSGRRINAVGSWGLP